jgi:molecular chaperone IbpA
MLTTLALQNNSNLSRYSVGFDDLITKLYKTVDSQVTTTHPPHNLVKESDTRFRIELALSGYSKDEINVSTEYNKLCVEAKKSEEDTTDEYVHRGIALRAFTKTFVLSDDVQISDVKLVDGLLVIHLNRVIPEHQQKKIYSIT